MATDYTALDAAILRRIGDGSNTFTSIFAREVRDIADDLCKGSSGRDAFRVVDRRLQALRKAGRISFLTMAKWPGGWRIAEA